MPNKILQAILRSSGGKWSVEDLLTWINYVPYAKEKDYIIKVAKLLYETK